MNEFDQVQVSLDAEKKLVVRLVASGPPFDDQELSVPDYLVGDFRDQIEKVLGF